MTAQQRLLSFLAGRKTVGRSAIGQIDAQVGRVRCRDGLYEVGVVCCCDPCAQVHAGKHNFRPVTRATERISASVPDSYDLSSLSNALGNKSQQK
jgi:hypothetical protein